MLSGVVDEEVNSVEEALNLLETGNAMRVTMATEMNAHSSRSHVAFIVTIGEREGKERGTKKRTKVKEGVGSMELLYL